MPSYWLPNGRIGHLMWFFTEEPFRRQGTASLMVDDLLAWLRTTDVLYSELYATDHGLSLYTSKGFQPATNANYWLRLTP
jgi:GNAT superfamily N-acetyltransferase